MQCHEELDELAKNSTVHIKWIAAHVGHWGNERADELAKIGITSTSLVKGYIPQSHIKALINHQVYVLNQVEWTRNGHCHTNSQHHVRKPAQTHHQNAQRTVYQNSLQNCPPVLFTFIYIFISPTASLPPEAGKAVRAIPL